MNNNHFLIINVDQYLHRLSINFSIWLFCSKWLCLEPLDCQQKHRMLEKQQGDKLFLCLFLCSMEQLHCNQKNRMLEK